MPDQKDKTNSEVKREQLNFTLQPTKATKPYDKDGSVHVPQKPKRDNE